MNWANQIVFWIPLLIVVGILLWLWRKDITTGQLQIGKVQKAIKIVVVVILIQYGLKIGLFYWFLKKDPLGSYLLPGGGTNFFLQNVWVALKPLFLATLVAVVLVLMVILIKRLIQRPLFEDIDVYVIFLTSFLVGFPGIFVLLIATFLLMIIWQLINGAVTRSSLSQFRLRLSPFLLFVCLAQLVLNNFSFYQNFLSWLHLV